MKRAASAIAALLLLAALIWLLVGEHAEGPPRGRGASDELLRVPDPLDAENAEELLSHRESPPTPAPSRERRDEPAGAQLCAIRGAIRGGELRDAVIALRGEDGKLRLAVLDVGDASFRAELPAGAYRACFASLHAPPLEQPFTVRPDERELELELAPRFWPVLPVEILSTAGAPLLATLGPVRYGWRASEGLGALGLALGYGEGRAPLGLRSELILRAELPIDVQLRWRELVLGEQHATSPRQKLAFSVDPGLFDRGAPARLSLRAIDARTRAGLARAELELEHDFGSRRCAPRDDEGRIEAEDLPAGKLRLRITAPGYAPTTRELELLPGEELELGEIACTAEADRETTAPPRLVRCALHVLAYPTQPIVLLEGESGVRELARWSYPTIDLRELPAGRHRVRCGERILALEVSARDDALELALP